MVCFCWPAAVYFWLRPWSGCGCFNLAMLWLLALAVILLLLGGLALRQSGSLRQQTGLPPGRLVYADVPHSDWHAPAQPLFSPTHNLVGKPDYLVRTAKGLIPVEVKSSAAPPLPYLGHVLQLAAYGLLIEATTGEVPPHGLLKYSDALYEIDFTPELRQVLLETIGDMRQAWLAENVNRSHQQPQKCAGCGFQRVCEEKLS
ncbi:MAG: PD-(D/E)XK nuclease family protein [Chloroflexota bacterium]